MIFSGFAHKSINNEQPLEDGIVTISRAVGSVRFPAKFLLLATQNPCPCGYLHDPIKHCRCSPAEIRRYSRKVSGPLLDRIDLHVPVPRVAAEDLSSKGSFGESSETIRSRVQKARNMQQQRFSDEGFMSNAEMNLQALEKYAVLSPAAEQMLKDALERLGLSARVYHRTIKVARTIADLAGNKDIDTSHIAEALQFREMVYSSI